ncbi:MAG: hypothetical protein AB8G23_15115 [Myxococcota bacterium]
MSLTPDGPETLSEALGFPETVLEIGQPHPGVRRVLTPAGGTVGFVVSLDDERMTSIDVELGLGHRGFEKEVESVPWSGALPYVRRLGFAGGLIAEVGYCLAVEALVDLPLPDRSVWLRMLGSELARVTDHFARLSAISASIAMPAAEQAAQWGEVEASRLLQAVTGRGVLEGWLCIGGVRSGLPPDFAASFASQKRRIEQAVDRFRQLAVDNPSCRRRLRGVGKLSADEALTLGLTGIPLRATGKALDVRHDRPYLAYGSVDFDIPVGSVGDNLDRLLVTVDEIVQSLRIAEQCAALLESIGPGEVVAQDSPWTLEGRRDRVGADAEEPLVPAGEAALSVEASTGEMHFFLVSDGKRLPRRIRCRPPSLFHAQAVPTMMRGERLDDLMPTAAGLHLVSGECDR